MTLRRARFAAPLALLLVLFSSRVAHADDCPAGSTMKTEEGFSFCQPSVCQSDGNCSPSEVCRTIALCVQVGRLGEQGAANDAAQRLVATQRCAPDKTCPATTTCSDMPRCVSKAVAEKMGILTAPAAPGAASAGAPDTKKSSCGCTVVGGRADGGPVTFALPFALGVAMLGAIIRGRRGSRADRGRSNEGPPCG